MGKSSELTINDEWQTIPLEQLIVPGRSISYGIVQPGSSDANGIPIVRVTDVRNGRISITSPMRVSPKIETSYSRTRLQGGELLLTLVGTVGETAVVPVSLRGWNTARAVCVIPVQSEISAYWIRLALQSPTVRHLIDSRLNTTVQATLNLSDVAKLPITLPPRQERDKISHILGTLDNKIELNQQMNKTLEIMGKTIFKHWFIDFEFLNDDCKPYKSSGGDMANSELGKIPTGWKIVKLQDITIRKKFAIVDGPFGTQLHSDEYVPTGISVIKITNLSFDGRFLQDKITYITEEKFNSLIRSAIYPGDILLAKTGDTIGKFSILPSYIEKALISSSILKISPDPDKFNKYYIYNIIQKLSERDYWKSISAGSTRPTITLNDVKDILIIYPPDEIMKQYYLIADAFFETMEKNEIESMTLSKIRDLLLPKLMSGKIRVPVGVK